MNVFEHQSIVSPSAQRVGSALPYFLHGDRLGLALYLPEQLVVQRRERQIRHPDNI